jgi:hypothetical protein
VPVDPDLDRVREVGTDLDERWAELVVPEVEVVAGDPPVGLGERERHDLAVVSGELDHRDVLVVGERATAFRNAAPILSKIAGEGIG